MDSRGLTQTYRTYQIRNWKRMGPFEQAHTQASERGEPYKPTRTDKTQIADGTPLWWGRAAPGAPTLSGGKAKRRPASEGSLAASYRPQKCFTISSSNCPPWYSPSCCENLRPHHMPQQLYSKQPQPADNQDALPWDGHTHPGHPQSGPLFSEKEKSAIKPQNNMAKSRLPPAKRKNPVQGRPGGSRS